MASGQSDPNSPVSLGRRPGLSHDGRLDLGYGTSKEKFHAQRKKSKTFPYDEPADDEDIDLGFSIDQIKKIKNKITTPFKSSDFLIGRSIDHVTVANGNHPIAIGEVSGKSLVPFPGMYKRRLQVGGGVNSPKLVSPGQYNRTGTDRGWSHAPIPLDTEPKDEDDLSPDEQGLKKIKDLVKMVLIANSKEL